MSYADLLKAIAIVLLTLLAIASTWYVYELMNVALHALRTGATLHWDGIILAAATPLVVSIGSLIAVAWLGWGLMRPDIR